MVAVFVAFMFVSLVLADLCIKKWKARRAVETPQTAMLAGDDLLQVPENLHLSDVHTWTRPHPAGGLEIGADTFIGCAVGTVQRIILPQRGDQVTAGQPLFRIERDGRTLTVPSALTGIVVTVNGLVAQQPGLLNSDPYGRGWICQITPTALSGTPGTMRSGEQAILWLESEFTRLRQFLSTRIPAQLPVGATSQDGGLPSAGCLAELDHAAWSAFQAEFLKPKL
jgi:glycine cleavage system H protein